MCRDVVGRSHGGPPLTNLVLKYSTRAGTELVIAGPKVPTEGALIMAPRSGFPPLGARRSRSGEDWGSSPLGLAVGSFDLSSNFTRGFITTPHFKLTAGYLINN